MASGFRQSTSDPVAVTFGEVAPLQTLKRVVWWKSALVLIGRGRGKLLCKHLLLLAAKQQLTKVEREGDHPGRQPLTSAPGGGSARGAVSLHCCSALHIPNSLSSYFNTLSHRPSIDTTATHFFYADSRVQRETLQINLLWSHKSLIKPINNYLITKKSINKNYYE